MQLNLCFMTHELTRGCSFRIHDYEIKSKDGQERSMSFFYARLFGEWEYASSRYNEIKMCVRRTQLCLCMCVCTVSVLMMQNQLKSQSVGTAAYVSARASPLL